METGVKLPRFILAALTLANIGTIIDAFFGATLPLAG